MINHRSGTSARLVRDAGVCQLVAEGAYAEGEQVFVSYGELDNLKLLLRYGFALADNEESVL
eukprot:4688242-Prymnesium_polylepis.2